MSAQANEVRQGTIAKRLLPRVGLGCMGMSEFYGPSDEAKNIDLLLRALELGYVHFDTADMYGNGANEQLLGQFLSRVPREKVFLATKFGIVRGGTGGLERTLNGRPDYVRAACERSLQRLGTSYIDLYYVHRRDTSVPIEETVGAMADLVKAGKIRAIGLSEVSVKTLRAAHAVAPIAAVQTEYSLVSREPERELLPACRELGVSFVAYSPLSRGLLTGTLTSERLRAGGDVRQYLPRFAGDNLARNSALLKQLHEVAQTKSCTLSQLALAWVLAQGDDIHAIPGTRSERYLLENFAAGKLTLSSSEVTQISRAIDVSLVAGARYPQGAMQGIGE
ncbi:MAG: aldo/keto reductase [Myxococcota bacterium]